MAAIRSILGRAPALLLVVIVMAMLVLPASALTAGSTAITADIEPGQTYGIPLLISAGPGEEAGRVSLGVSGLGQSPFDGNYTALEAGSDTGAASARAYITLNTTTVRLEPGGNAEVMVTVRVPGDVRDGGRYAAILVQRDSSSPGQRDILIPIFLTVKGGNITESAEITALEFTSVQPGEDFLVRTSIRNTGNYYITGMVNTVVLENSRGGVVATATSSMAHALVPGQEVGTSVTFKGGVPDGATRLVTRMEKADGTFIAEQEEAFQAGDVAGLDTTPPVSIPGFSACLAGIAMAALGGRVKRRPRIPVSAGGTPLTVGAGL